MSPHIHSAAFVAEMKQRLLEEKKLLETELSSLATKHTNVPAEEFTAKFPDYGRSEEDNATEMADYEATAATTKANEVRLREIEAALQRIEDGRYGVSDDGRLIPEERLRANPAATTLVEDEKK